VWACEHRHHAAFYAVHPSPPPRSQGVRQSFAWSCQGSPFASSPRVFYILNIINTVNISEPELHRWFWGETAVAQLIRAVSQRMSASDDHALTYVAYGLAR
jgi:hypothetical protein